MRRRPAVRVASTKLMVVLAAAGAALSLAATAPQASAAAPSGTGLTLTTMATVPPPSPTPQPIRRILLTGPWGGYSNGKIPLQHMCFVAKDQKMRCDAAQQFRLMSAQFNKRWHKPLCVTVAYRSYETQAAMYKANPGMTAKPGTSNHGWGLAVDLCGGVQGFGTPQYAWMKANAAVFGFVHPLWAEQGSSREEPWHWEFGHTAGTRY